MTRDAPILLRCPTCDRIGQESMIRDERFVCGCGSVAFARDPEGYGPIEERRAAAVRLSKFTKIDLPSAYSVLLQMMSVRDARRLHDTRIAQLPHIARRNAMRAVEKAKAESAADHAGAEASEATETADATQRSSPEPSGAHTHEIDHTDDETPLPGRPNAQPMRPFRPRGPSPLAKKSEPRLDADSRRWYRDLAIAACVFVAFAATGIAAKQVGRKLTEPQHQSIYVSEKAVVRLDGAGKPVEIRSQDPSYVLRRYCRETGCRAFALAMPNWLPNEARLGLFETEGGVTGAIRIERASLDDWIAGGGTTAIEVFHNPPIPPRTPMVTLSR